MLTAQFKLNFFDAKPVTSRVDAATRKVLSKFGAYVRTRARSSIRKRKGASQPGQPPSSHVGTLKDKIFFAYDPGRDNVVIGPALFEPASTGHWSAVSGTGPEVLEKGGSLRAPRLGRRHGKFFARRNTKVRRIAPRPFMLPAFEKEKTDQMPATWRDSVK